MSTQTATMLRETPWGWLNHECYDSLNAGIELGLNPNAEFGLDYLGELLQYPKGRTEMRRAVLENPHAFGYDPRTQKFTLTKSNARLLSYEGEADYQREGKIGRQILPEITHEEFRNRVEMMSVEKAKLADSRKPPKRRIAPPKQHKLSDLIRIVPKSRI